MLPRIMGEIANVSDPIKRRLLGHGAERVEKLNARLAAPDSAGARADAVDRSREAEQPLLSSETRSGRVKTAGTDGLDGRDRTPRLSANAAESGFSDERLHASESLAATTDEWLREEIAKRERALAELEAFRERYDGIAADQAGLLETEIASRKAVEVELASPSLLTETRWDGCPQRSLHGPDGSVATT